MITVRLDINPCPRCGRPATIQDGVGPDNDVIVEIQCNNVTCPDWRPHWEVRPRYFRYVSMDTPGWVRRTQAAALELAAEWNART